MKNLRFAAAASLLLVMILAFTGCTGNTGNNTGNATDEPGEVVETATPFNEKENATHPPAKANIAKVILILGQSNAVGASLFSPLKDIIDKDKYNFLYKTGFDDIRIVFHAGEDNATNYRAKQIETITVEKLFDRVKFGKSLTGMQFGLEVGIADYLNETVPGEKYYIIKVARGGEALSPKFLEGGELFERAMTIIEGSFSVMKREGLEPEIIAICWMQGENESGSQTTARAYGEGLKKLTEQLRKHLAEYAPWGGIPFIDAGISSYWTYYKIINQEKADFAAGSVLNYYIDSMSLGLTYDKEPADNPDLAHFDSESELILGREFGKIILEAYDKVK